MAGDVSAELNEAGALMSPEEIKKQGEYLTRREIDGLITERLLLFHEAVVKRGQIHPFVQKQWMSKQTGRLWAHAITAAIFFFTLGVPLNDVLLL